jgi:MscS family membrane protein
MLAYDIFANITAFLNTDLAGNTVSQWAQYAAVLLGTLIVGKTISFFLARHGKKLAAIDRLELPGRVIYSLAGPAAMILFAGGLYVGGLILVMQNDVRVFYDQVAKTIAVLAATWWLFRLVDIVEYLLSHWTGRTETTLDDQLVPLIRKTLRLVVVIIGILFIAQNVFEWDIAALIAGLGLGGLAFALAAKDMLSNLFGSLTIFADRPFAMGDRIVVQDHDGFVEQVGFRSTRIRLLNGHVTVIPNSVIANEAVENISLRPYIKRVLDVTVTYDTPPEKIRLGISMIEEMLEARKSRFHPDFPPRVYFNDFNAASLNIVVYMWFVPPDWWEYLAFCHDFNMELLERFNNEGIEFAFPTQTLYVKQDSPLHADVKVQPSSDR